jgi:DNA polymerase-3 subunit alpha
MLLETYLREWERENDIQCGYGRGSVSGSLIAYALGITQMDSLKFDLNFFRFMNPGRVTNADIDTDYCSKDREKIKYFLLHDRMNLPHIKTSEIITFNTIATKGAIKDVCRALNISLDEAQQISDAVNIDGTIDDKWKEQYPEVF